MFYVCMENTFDLVRVEGARIPLPPEFADFCFFVHNSVTQDEEGNVRVWEDQYSVSERESGSTVAEGHSTVAEAEQAARKFALYAGTIRLRNVIDKAVRYAEHQRGRTKRGYRSKRGIPYNYD